MVGKGTPSLRATAVAEGLVRTGRAVLPHETAHGFITLSGSAWGRYWISYDGTRLLRGVDFRTAEELQPGFIDAMERAGANPPAVERG